MEPARNNGNINPIEQRTNCGTCKQEIPEPQEEENFLVKHVDHKNTLHSMSMNIAQHLERFLGKL